MKNKNQYTPPTVKVVAFKVEDIFLSRGISLTSPEPVDNYNDNNIQNWSNGGSLFGQSNDWDN